MEKLAEAIKNLTADQVSEVQSEINALSADQLAELQSILQSGEFSPNEHLPDCQSQHAGQCGVCVGDVFYRCT